MASFENIMGRFDGEERRALADLRALGFPFRSIAAARRYHDKFYKNRRQLR